MMNWLKTLMSLILVNLLTKQSIMPRSKILKKKNPSITNLVHTAVLTAVESKKLRKNTLIPLIIINLRMLYWMQT